MIWRHWHPPPPCSSPSTRRAWTVRRTAASPRYTAGISPTRSVLSSAGAPAGGDQLGLWASVSDHWVAESEADRVRGTGCGSSVTSPWFQETELYPGVELILLKTVSWRQGDRTLFWGWSQEELAPNVNSVPTLRVLVPGVNQWNVAELKTVMKYKFNCCCCFFHVNWLVFWCIFNLTRLWNIHNYFLGLFVRASKSN